MSQNNRNHLCVKFDITYGGEELTTERMKELESQIIKIGHQTMLDSSPVPRSPEYRLRIHHGSQDAAVAAVQFALEADEGLEFLRCWNYGEFDVIRREWPEAPESVFIGADTLHPKTVV